METGSFDGARRARLMRERVWARYGVVGRPVYIGVLIHICMFIHGERPVTRTESGGQPSRVRVGGPPRAERNHPAGMKRAWIQEEPRWKTRAFDVDGVL